MTTKNFLFNVHIRVSQKIRTVEPGPNWGKSDRMCDGILDTQSFAFGRCDGGWLYVLLLHFTSRYLSFKHRLLLLHSTTSTTSVDLKCGQTTRVGHT